MPVNFSRPRGLTVAELGQLCLDYLAEDAQMLSAFMASAGYDPAGLRAALGSPALMRGLVDHFASNESLLIALCAANSLRPEDFMRAYHAENRGG